SRQDRRRRAVEQDEAQRAADPRHRGSQTCRDQQSEYTAKALQAEMCTKLTLDQPCSEQGFSGVAQRKDNGACEISIAVEVRRERRSDYSGDYRQARARPKSGQRTGRDARGGPEHGHSITLRQKNKTQTCREEVQGRRRCGETDPGPPAPRFGPGMTFPVELLSRLAQHADPLRPLPSRRARSLLLRPPTVQPIGRRSTAGWRCR